VKRPNELPWYVTAGCLRRVNESNEAWQITTNHFEEQYRSFGSSMSTAERDVLFSHHRQEHRLAATKPHTMQHWKTLG